MAKKDDSNGRWVTIGGSVIEDEHGEKHRHGGSPVFIRNGKIEKGAPSLVGRKISAMKEEPESTHRKDLNREKDYSRAVFAKRARAAGVDPDSLHRLAAELMAHDREHVEERRHLLKDARNYLTKLGYNTRALTTNLRSGHVEDNIPGIDLVARTMANRYPGQFVSHTERVNDDVERLTDLLTQGNPQPMSQDDAYETALSHLEEYGAGGSELSNEPLDIDEGPDIGEWGGGATSAPLIPPSPRPPAQIRSAWDRFFSGNEASGGGGSLFGSGDLAGRAALSRLPEGSGVLITEGNYKGATGKIVRDPHNNRIAVEVDNAPHLGLVPVDHNSIEPLSPAQSWRTEAASAPSEQRSLLDASHFLPRRRDEDDEAVPFSRREYQNMRSTWNNRSRALLSPAARTRQSHRPSADLSLPDLSTATPWDNLTAREMNARATRVQQFARDMSGDYGEAFDRATHLDQLLGGRKPSEVDAMIDEGRKRVERGQSLETVAETIAAQLSAAPEDTSQTPERFRAREIGNLVRTALTQNISLAEAAERADEETPSLPSSEERQEMQFAREHEMLQFSRVFGYQPSAERQVGREEFNKAVIIASERKLSFDDALRLVRSGR